MLTTCFLFAQVAQVMFARRDIELVETSDRENKYITAIKTNIFVIRVGKTHQADCIYLHVRKHWVIMNVRRSRCFMTSLLTTSHLLYIL